MNDPATTTTETGWAAAAGSMAAFFAAIGVSWALVFWGVVGGLFGITWAPQAGRVRSILMFPASALLSAKIGVLGSAHFFAGSADWAGGIAAVAGIILHPVIGLIVKALPMIAQRLGASTK